MQNQTTSRSNIGSQQILPEQFSAALLEQGFTQSELQTLDNCPTRWYNRYVRLLEKKGHRSIALDYGTGVHHFLENWYATKGRKRLAVLQPLQNSGAGITHEMLAEQKYYKQLLELQTEIYASHYKNDFSIFKLHRCEHVASVRYRGFLLRGKLDLGMVDRRTNALGLWDHKTIARIDANTATGWQMRFQFGFYLWLAKNDPEWNDVPVKGFMVNAIKKPALRRGDRETTEGFIQRIRTDMLQKPETYFVREHLPLQKGQIDKFETEILDPKIDALELIFGKQPQSIGNGKVIAFSPPNNPQILNALVGRRNTDNCFHYNKPCEFLQLCLNGYELEKFAYQTRPEKHNEIDGQNNS